MAPQIGKCDDSELNPLLNPLLNKNMGRWAEVYFTSPPNKRAQAVRELVRELRSRELHNRLALTRARDAAPAQDQYRTTPAAAPRAADAPAPLGSARNQPFFAARYQARPYPTFHDRPRRRVPESGRNPPYLAIVMAIAVLLVGGIAWYRSQIPTARSLPAPPSPRISSVPQPAEKTALDTSDGDWAPRPQRNTAAGPTDRLAGAGADSALAATAVDPRQRAAASSSAASIAPGAAELATAKRYLEGSDGKPRDTAQAVLWLWRAVGKQNREATDLLSDLYLHGSGVPKNCDQARILIDAAAMKGDPQAAERLRHLQAFGCK